jgi:hypothetical protein
MTTLQITDLEVLYKRLEHYLSLSSPTSAFPGELDRSKIYATIVRDGPDMTPKEQIQRDLTLLGNILKTSKLEGFNADHFCCKYTYGELARMLTQVYGVE